jgi:hypothetical protein
VVYCFLRENLRRPTGANDGPADMHRTQTNDGRTTHAESAVTETQVTQASTESHVTHVYSTLYEHV